MKKQYVVGAVLAVAITTGGVLVGCGAKAQEPGRDAPKVNDHDRTPAKIIEFPDGFSNASVKCVGGIWMVSAFHGDDNRAAMSALMDPKFPNCSSVPALQQ